MRMNVYKLSILSLLVSTLFSPVHAEELSPVTIFGTQDENSIAGSAHYIGDEEMKRNNYTDSERIMRRIPGVY